MAAAAGHGAVPFPDLNSQGIAQQPLQVESDGEDDPLFKKSKNDSSQLSEHEKASAAADRKNRRDIKKAGEVFRWQHMPPEEWKAEAQKVR